MAAFVDESDLSWSLTLSQAHPGPTSVLIDEIDTGSNDRASNFFRSLFSPSQFTVRRFEASHGRL
jgi:hypothetical protein